MNKVGVVKYMLFWQRRPTELRVFTDSDWASCPETRRSTSGGIIMLGNALVSHWSRTQATIALSSAEAELNAVLKGAVEGLSLKQLGDELNIVLPLKIRGDASAVEGIVARQ